MKLASLRQLLIHKVSYIALKYFNMLLSIKLHRELYFACNAVDIYTNVEDFYVITVGYLQ